MTEKRTLQILSILVGTLIGCIIAYFYEANLWMYGIPFPIQYISETVPAIMWGWWSLMVFLTIPALAGFIAGLIDPSMGMQNGLYVGLLSGVVNAIIAVVRLFYLPVEQFPSLTILYAFSVFSIMSVFLWMIIGAAAGLLAKQY